MSLEIVIDLKQIKEEAEKIPLTLGQMQEMFNDYGIRVFNTETNELETATLHTATTADLLSVIKVYEDNFINAAKIAEIYFNIAAEALGEDEVKRKRDLIIPHLATKEGKTNINEDTNPYDLEKTHKRANSLTVLDNLNMKEFDPKRSKLIKFNNLKEVAIRLTNRFYSNLRKDVNDSNWDGLMMDVWTSLEAAKDTQPPIAGIVWEKRYSATEADDRFGRWMRIGRINEMTVAIITKAVHLEKIKYVLRLPNNKGDESLQSDIITNSENEAMLEAEKFIAGYVANFRKMEIDEK